MLTTRLRNACLVVLIWPAFCLATPAFPGAEGFGAQASGGRGGRVVYVTTLDPDPNGQTEGSLNWALRQPNSYVLFKVSGVIDGARACAEHHHCRPDLARRHHRARPGLRRPL